MHRFSTSQLHPQDGALRSRCIKKSPRRPFAPTRVTRFVAAACISALAALSLAPAEQMTRTDLGGHIEHVLAYVGTAFLSTAAFGERGISCILFALLTYAGALEFLQRFSPGRARDSRTTYLAVLA